MTSRRNPLGPVALLSALVFGLAGCASGTDPLPADDEPRLLDCSTATETELFFEATTEMTGMTVYQVLRDSGVAGFDGSGEMAFVTSICGVEADPGAQEFWSFLIDGHWAEVGVGSHIIEPGENITFELTTW